MNEYKNFLKSFSLKSRHHEKLINFVYPELIKIENCNILEFGVSEHAMTTELFLNYSLEKNCNLFSVDNVDYSNKFSNKKWKFILSRDDNFDYVEKKIPNQFNLILLDTIHEAKHVKNILYHYFDMLKLNGCFFIDDINWIPYLKNYEKNRFYNEVNNQETFEILLDIYSKNRDNMIMEFSFQGTGMCKIKKTSNLKLRFPSKIRSRKYSFKNLLRKIFNKN